LTHIRVSSDLLDDIVVKVARVAEEATGDVVGVLETLEQLGGDGELRALPKFGPLALLGDMHVLNPSMVGGSAIVLDVALELDHVVVGDLLGIGGGKERRDILVDGADVEGRGSCKQREQRGAEDRLHGGDGA
jgi:hypothetical protein